MTMQLCSLLERSLLLIILIILTGPRLLPLISMQKLLLHLGLSHSSAVFALIAFLDARQTTNQPPRKKTPPASGKICN